MLARVAMFAELLPIAITYGPAGLFAFAAAYLGIRLDRVRQLHTAEMLAAEQRHRQELAVLTEARIAEIKSATALSGALATAAEKVTALLDKQDPMHRVRGSRP